MSRVYLKPDWKKVTTMQKLLKSMIDGMMARNIPVDTIVIGSDIRAEEVRSALDFLGLDYHVIADDELSPSRVWVTSTHALSMIPGGGRN